METMANFILGSSKITAYGECSSEIEKKKKVKSLSRVQLFATLWTIAHQSPPSMGFSSQEYWNGLPFPSSGDLPDQGIEPRSPTLQAEALNSEPPGKTLKGPCKVLYSQSYEFSSSHIWM